MYIFENLLYRTSIASNDNREKKIFDPFIVTPSNERVELFHNESRIAEEKRKAAAYAAKKTQTQPSEEATVNQTKINDNEMSKNANQTKIIGNEKSKTVNQTKIIVNKKSKTVIQT